MNEGISTKGQIMTHYGLPHFPKLLSTKELAKVLKMSHRSLENMRQRGEGPKYIKVGRAVRYDLVDVQAWIPDLSLKH